MPTYEYVCDACGHQFERFQSITAAPERNCPKCRKRKVRRKIGVGAAILFKGTGFYETDYRSDGYAKAAEADRKNSDSAKPAETKPQASTETKSEAKAETKQATTTDTKPATTKPAKEPGVKALHPSREGRGQGNLRRSAPRARKARRGMALKKLAIALVVALLSLVLVGILGIDVIARLGIQTVGSRVLGVPTSVRSVSIGLISDTSSVNGLAVANPAGYTDPEFLTLGRAALTARLGELTADDTTIRSVVIRDVVLTLEKDASGKLNADRISDNLPASPKDGSQPAKTPAPGTSRTITVNEFRLEGVKVRLRNLVGGKAGVVEANLPDIALKNVKSDGSVDVLASQVSGVVIGSVLEATVKANIEGLSSEVVSGLKDAMKNAVDELPADLRGPVESIRGGVGEALDDAGKGIGDALGNIFGGNKGK